MVDKEKMKEVIHYIVNICGFKDNVGRTVLYKLLYFADFDHFEVYDKSITNETYLKYPKGPVPAHFQEIKNDLIREGKISEEITMLFDNNYKKYTYTAKKPLSFTKFLAKEEIKFIDHSIHALSHMNANEISEYSHKDIPWRVADPYKPIPYEATFYRNEPYIHKKIN